MRVAVFLVSGALVMQSGCGGATAPCTAEGAPAGDAHPPAGSSKPSAPAAPALTGEYEVVTMQKAGGAPLDFAHAFFGADADKCPAAYMRLKFEPTAAVAHVHFACDVYGASTKKTVKLLECNMHLRVHVDWASDGFTLTDGPSLETAAAEIADVAHTKGDSERTNDSTNCTLTLPKVAGRLLDREKAGADAKQIKVQFDDNVWTLARTNGVEPTPADDTAFIDGAVEALRNRK